jgi:reactive intermediate/imine deaminase
MTFPFLLVMEGPSQDCGFWVLKALKLRASSFKVPQMSSTPEKPPLTAVRFAGNIAYVSGQLPRGSDGAIVSGDARVQTRQSLVNLQRALASADLSLTDVVKVTAWITDARHMADFNSVYREFFVEPYPARSFVISALVAPDAVVEIEAVAGK